MASRQQRKTQQVQFPLIVLDKIVFHHTDQNKEMTQQQQSSLFPTAAFQAHYQQRQHFLPPSLMNSLTNSSVNLPSATGYGNGIEPSLPGASAELFKKFPFGLEEGATPIYPASTTATNQQQQPQAQFPWNITMAGTTLKEI